MKSIRIIKGICEKLNVPFYVGDWKEICVSLNLKSKLKQSGKYPFVVLSKRYTPIYQQPYIVEGIELYIVTQTKQNITTQQRDETVYTETLYPLYESIIGEIEGHRSVITSTSDYLGRLVHDVQNLYYFSTEGAEQNKLNDIVDAIQVKTNLKIRRNE